MRRSLVLTDESARHPFRASLPPHVRRQEEPISPRAAWRLSREDVREFGTTFTATFVAASIFIL
ncbi:hypothetical protein [Qipengyuania sp. JC766]|uniref:hypothetical protein n=1 Tax=Qipengyuania sp. JC766 TaxID=3232139 RepID=UPI003457E27F